MKIPKKMSEKLFNELIESLYRFSPPRSRMKKKSTQIIPDKKKAKSKIVCRKTRVESDEE